MPTAEDTVLQCRAVLRNGAWDFISKPLDHTLFVARVRHAVELQRKRKEQLHDTLEFARRVEQLTTPF